MEDPNRMLSVAIPDDGDYLEQPGDLEVTALVLDGKYVLDGDFGTLAAALDALGRPRYIGSLMLRVDGPADIQRVSSGEMRGLRKRASQLESMLAGIDLDQRFIEMAERMYGEELLGSDYGRSEVILALRNWKHDDAPDAAVHCVDEFKRDNHLGNKRIRKLAKRLDAGFRMGPVLPAKKPAGRESQDGDEYDYEIEELVGFAEDVLGIGRKDAFGVLMQYSSTSAGTLGGVAYDARASDALHQAVQAWMTEYGMSEKAVQVQAREVFLAKFGTRP